MTKRLRLHNVRVPFGSPLDEAAIVAAVNDIGALLTVEEHQVGGFGNIIAGVAAQVKNPRKPLHVEMMGVPDKFGESGQPWELMKVFGLTAEHIARKTLEMVGQK